MLQNLTRIKQNYVFYTIIALVLTLLISLAALQVFAAILFIFWLAEKNELKLKGQDVISLLISAFLVIRIISIMFSAYPSSSVQSFYKEALYYTTFFSLMSYLKVFDIEKIRKIYNWTIYGGVLAALIGIFLFINGSVDRAQSFGSGYSTYSTYLLTIFVLILAKRYNTNDFKEMAVWSLFAAISLSGVILSLGRANIAIAIVFAVYFVFRNKVNIKAILLFVILTGAISFISFQFNSSELGQRMENPTTLSDRDVIYKGFGMLYNQNPFWGFGPRTFNDIFPLRSELADKGVGSWHNDYIQIYMESGIFALIVFIYLLWIIFWRGRNLIFKKYSGDTTESIELGIYSGIFAMAVSGLTGTFLFSPVLSIFFAFLLSMFSYLFQSGNGEKTV